MAGGWLKSVVVGVFKRAGDSPASLPERAGLPVVAKLARNRIDLGKGARSIVHKGAFVAKYEIVVPRALVPS